MTASAPLTSQGGHEGQPMTGIYIHVPFCRRRCTYCDFYFVTGTRHIDTFADSVTREIELRSRLDGKGRRVETIYFGGGTPSRLPVSSLHRILDTIRSVFDTGNVSEITVEMNPEDVSGQVLDDLLGLGVNRVSLGVQSFSDSTLSFLNRGHSAAQALDSVELCASRLETFSIDLIFGVPGQSNADWLVALSTAVREKTPHISAYGLTVEPRTVLGNLVRRGKVKPVDDDTMGRQFLETSEFLSRSGYEHYEVSNFALRGHRSKHNQLYWTHHDYLGFGPSAHSFSWLQGSTAERTATVRNVVAYQDALGRGEHPPADVEQLTTRQLAVEYILFSSRLADGIDLDRLAADYGVAATPEALELIARMNSEGLLQLTDGRLLVPTKRGMALNDSIALALVDALLPSRDTGWGPTGVRSPFDKTTLESVRTTKGRPASGPAR